jgi:hypothetical protein
MPSNVSESHQPITDSTLNWGAGGGCKCGPSSNFFFTDPTGFRQEEANGDFGGGIVAETRISCVLRMKMRKDFKN